MNTINYTELIDACLNGDKEAANKLLSGIQQQVYNIAVRFFWNPADAEDATQEILLKVLTHLSGFRGESNFTTWVYRVATNYLLNAKRTQTEYLTFEEGAAHLEKGMLYPAYDYADKDILEEEVKISCSTSMLICVSRSLRLAYLVGEILEFDSNEASFILDVDAATFRKRLSLARKKIRAFMAKQCGIYNPSNSCRCAKQIQYCIDVDWFKPDRLNFMDKAVTTKQIRDGKKEIENIMNDAAIFHSHPNYKTPERILSEIRQLLNSDSFPLMVNKN